jgi:TM2 domain-containing membrane protein YozV
MKNIGLILVAGVTIPILLLVGIYILWPSGRCPGPAGHLD